MAEGPSVATLPGCLGGHGGPGRYRWQRVGCASAARARPRAEPMGSMAQQTNLTGTTPRWGATRLPPPASPERVGEGRERRPARAGQLRQGTAPPALRRLGEEALAPDPVDPSQQPCWQPQAG
eukprot:scaffold849_cov386-Prasinococcus_capsulatus_cf.AAC.10